jgi:hypothetical protein
MTRGLPIRATSVCSCASFARSLGCIPDFGAFELYSARPLGPDAVLAVHTEGEDTFAKIGKGYPGAFGLTAG